MGEITVLQHRQALIVIHGEDRVHVRELRRDEGGVRGYRAAQAHPPCRQIPDHRFDHLDFLAPQMPGFAGMRVQAADQNTRVGDAEFVAQIAVQHLEHRDQPLARDRARHRRERKMNRGQCHTQTGAGEHHHRLCRAALRGE
jgi:hypothetical protein